MGRSVLDLGATATLLDASDRLREAPADGDLAVVVVAGAPLLRNAVFLDVLRTLADGRRISLVTNDARARSLAASVHLPAYASLAALERHELDPTERLEPARRAAIAASRSVSAPRAGMSARRALASLSSLLGAVLVLLAVVGPQATVFVAPTVEPLGPVTLELRAGPGGEVEATPLTATVSKTVSGRASGFRIDEIKASGGVQLTNRTTDEIRIAKSTIFQTTSGVRFVTAEERTLPRSLIVPPFDIVLGHVNIPVEAAVAGTAGNVPAGRITVSPAPSRYEVTNPLPTSGGDLRRIAVVQGEDYDALVQRAQPALQEAADQQLAKWQREAASGSQVVGKVLGRLTSVAPAKSDVVGREVETFELTVNGIASSYSIASDQPRRTAVDRLRESLEPGMAMVEGAAVVDDVKVEMSDLGVVTWKLAARASQYRRPDRAGIGRLLAGVAISDAKPVLDREGLRLLRVEHTPAWWPRLPLLDGRITVQVEAPATPRASLRSSLWSHGPLPLGPLPLGPGG